MKLNGDHYREVNAEIRDISLKDYRLGGWEWDEIGHSEQEEEWKKGREREIDALGLDTSCLTELYFFEEEHMLSLVIV